MLPFPLTCPCELWLLQALLQLHCTRQGKNKEKFLKCLDNIPATSKNTQRYGDKLQLHTAECFCVGSNVSPKLCHC